MCVAGDAAGVQQRPPAAGIRRGHSHPVLHCRPREGRQHVGAWDVLFPVAILERDGVSGESSRERQRELDKRGDCIQEACTGRTKTI